MSPVVAAAVLSLLAVMVTARPTHSLARLAPPVAVASRPRRRRVLIGALSLCLALVLGGPELFVACTALGIVGSAIAWQVAAHRRRQAVADRRAAVVEALDLFAADLTAGRPPLAALEGAAAGCADLRIPAAVARLGGDVPKALERTAAEPGVEGLRALAAAWRITEESGAAFAQISSRLADSLRADEAVHRQTAASLASARTTARILAGLPVAGLALGYALGGHPLDFLLGNAFGRLCLFAGLGLTCVGLFWTQHLSEVRP